MPETEKITINMSAVDLGKVDLLVQEGLYANRSDFIRTAIRNQLDRHALEIQQSVTRHAYVIGVLMYTRADLERYKDQGIKLEIKALGFLHLDDEIPAALAAEVIETVQVRGIFQASNEVKAILASRMK